MSDSDTLPPKRSKPRRPTSPARERFERIYRTLRDRICLLNIRPARGSPRRSWRRSSR